MSDIARRLLKAIRNSGKSYQELSDETGIPKSTIQRYATGSTNKMDVDVITELAKALSEKPIDILGWGAYGSDMSYYLDNETAKMAQELKDNKELRLLFDASRDATPDDLKQTADYLMFLKRKERGE